jgi:hypothetical protein
MFEQREQFYPAIFKILRAKKAWTSVRVVLVAWQLGNGLKTAGYHHAISFLRFSSLVLITSRRIDC